MSFPKHKSKAGFYKNKADYFKGVARMRRLTACVHLEGDSDKHFWTKIFKIAFPRDKFFFLTYSKTIGENKVSGVENCLKYAPYLSGNFFICIDSDYRYLTKRRDVSIRDFIFQTYTYSIENHYCFAQHLNEVCYKCSGVENTIFDFDKFFSDYSKIIYELFIWHIYVIKTGKRGITKLKFNEILTNFPRVTTDDNGSLMLRSLQDRVNKKIDILRDKHPDVNISDYYGYFTKLGLYPHNTYLFVRGHNIYDFTIKLGRNCCRKLRDMNSEQSNFSSDDLESFYEGLPTFEQAMMELLAEAHYPQLAEVFEDAKYYTKYLKNIR